MTWKDPVKKIYFSGKVWLKRFPKLPATSLPFIITMPFHMVQKRKDELGKQNNDGFCRLWSEGLRWWRFVFQYLCTHHLIWSSHENNEKYDSFLVYVFSAWMIRTYDGCSKLKSNDRWPLDYPTYPRQQFLSKEAPTAILAAKISDMKLNLASCRITTVISCCLDKIATKLCHNASKWSLKWPVNIVERRRIIPEFKLEENWAKIIGLFVRILAGDRGIISKFYILHLI